MEVTRIVLGVAWALVALVLAVALVYLTLILVEVLQMTKRFNAWSREMENKIKTMVSFITGPLAKGSFMLGRYWSGKKRKKKKGEAAEEE